MYVCVCLYVCMFVCMYVCMPVCVSVCTYVLMYVCLNVFLYVCMCVCMYVRMYACMYVRMTFKRVEDQYLSFELIVLQCHIIVAQRCCTCCFTCTDFWEFSPVLKRTPR